MYATFDTFRTDRPRELAELLIKEVRERIRPRPGFVRANVLLSLDATTAVIHCRWAEWTSSPVTEWPGAAMTSFGGAEMAGITGPEPSAEPDIAAVATRHVAGPEAARDLGALLVRSGGWKQSFPGFIGATAYLSADGLTYVNYPQWTSVAAYRSYMDDPRIPAGQQEAARLEVAPPEFVLARVAADIGPRQPHQGGAVTP